MPAESVGPDDLGTVDRAIAALESQRSVLGAEVVDLALESLRQRRHELLLRESGEQRKLVTVLFADVVDFTVLSRRLDPEDTRAVMSRYFARWQEIILAHGGTLEKFIGDAVMAVFGLYRSEEDDAQRAVRAATAMISALPELNAEIEPRFGIRLAMRTGVDTGDVVISTLDERAGHDFVVVGPTVNRAARLQSAAPIDRVLISGDTQRQIRGRFALEPQPPLRLKGIDEPVETYLVGAERPLAFRLDRTSGVAGVQTTTVGRDLDLHYLQEQLLDTVAESRLRMVTVLGDAGVGKSRLLFDFDSWIGNRPEVIRWFRGRAAPLGQNRPYALLRDVLRGRLGITDSDTPAEVLTKFSAEFSVAAAPVVATWLGFEVGATAPVPTDPQSLQTEGESALADFFAASAAQAPVVLLLEDLHWADDATLSWLGRLDQRLAGAPVLVVGTARPALLDRRPRWGEGLPHHSRRELAPLSARATRELLGQILHRVESPPAALIDLVVNGAEGNPFYLEELVTWLIDEQVIVVGEPSWRVATERFFAIEVPSTLRGVLQARLDALSADERITLQRASVIGRVFWDDAVARLGEPGATAPAELFEALRRRQIVFERELSAFDDAREYLFKHALLRDVAYDGVLRSHRERYHRGAAAWLAEVSRTNGREPEYAALIAEHYDKGRDPQAARWYLRAGRSAAAVYALDDAARLLDRALAVVPETEHALRFDVLAAREDVWEWLGDRAEQRALLTAMAAVTDLDPARRVRLLLARARLRFLLSDYPGSSRAADQALALAESEGLREQAGDALLWRGKSQVWNDETTAARDSLQRALVVGEQRAVPFLAGEALRYLAMAANNVGDYAESLELSRRAQQIFTEGGHLDAATMAQAMYATTCFNMGRIAESRRGMEELIPLFVRSGNRYRQAVALGNLASIAATEGELAQAEIWAREAATLTEGLTDREATAVNLTVVGEIEVLLGRTADAVATLTRVRELATDRSTGGIAATALALTAVALLEADRLEQALQAAAEAVSVAPEESTPIDRGRALLGLGYVQAAAGHPAAAGSVFGAAETLFRGIERQSFALEAQVGRAAALTALGRRDEGLLLAHRVLSVGVEVALANCLRATVVLYELWRVLADAGDPAAPRVREQGRTHLRRQAALIGDDAMAASYLARPEVAALLGDRQP